MVAVQLPEAVRSRRLLLRRWTVDDVDLLAAAVANNIEHLRPWMPWVADEPMARSERAAVMHDWDRGWRTGGDVVMAMVLDGEVVGGTGLHRGRDPRCLEIGYWVDRGHTGQGLATEATETLTGVAFSMPDIETVEIHHDRANVASGAVPARLGYAFAGERTDGVQAPGECGIDCTWRVTRAGWTALRAS